MFYQLSCHLCPVSLYITSMKKDQARWDLDQVTICGFHCKTLTSSFGHAYFVESVGSYSGALRAWSSARTSNTYKFQLLESISTSELDMHTFLSCNNFISLFMALFHNPWSSLEILRTSLYYFGRVTLVDSTAMDKWWRIHLDQYICPISSSSLVECGLTCIDSSWIDTSPWRSCSIWIGGLSPYVLSGIIWDTGMRADRLASNGRQISEHSSRVEWSWWGRLQNSTRVSLGYCLARFGGQ